MEENPPGGEAPSPESTQENVEFKLHDKSGRWGHNEDGNITPQGRLRDRVAYYEKLQSPCGKNTADKDVEDSFSIDVNAFEKKLKEERDRQQLAAESPQMEFVKLRSIPLPSPRQIVSPDQTNKNLMFGECLRSSTSNSSPEEAVGHTVEKTQAYGNTRLVSFEKITSYRSVRKLKTSGDTESTLLLETTISRPLERQFTPVENPRDLLSPLGISKISKCSIHSSTYDRLSPEEQHSATCTHRNLTKKSPTGEQERVICDCPGGDVSFGNRNQQLRKTSRASSFFTEKFTPTSISSVGGSQSDRSDQEPSVECYSEFKSQPLFKMTSKQFGRSNSQYDSHIRQIRGKYLSIAFMANCN